MTRIATFNIAHGRGRDRVVDLGRTADVLRSLDADVICLQEVDRHFSGRSGWVDQLGALEAELGMSGVYGASVRRPPPGPGRPWREYGNSVLSRVPDQDRRVVPLPVRPGREARSLLLVRLATGGAEVTVGTVHLQHDSPAERAEQARAVLQSVAGEEPLVLCGDFNAAAEAPELASLRAALVNCWPAGRGRWGWRGGMQGGTFPSRWPRRRIDHVLVSPSVRVLAASVVPTDASDHRPLVVELVLPN